MRGLTVVVEDEAMVVLVVQGIGCGSYYHVKIRGTEDGWNAVPFRLRRLHVYIGMEHPHAWITS